MAFPTPPRPVKQLIRREFSTAALVIEFGPEQLLAHPLNSLEIDYEPISEPSKPYLDPIFQAVPYADRPRIPKPDGEVARLKRGGYNLEQQLQWDHTVYLQVMVGRPECR